MQSERWCHVLLFLSLCPAVAVRWPFVSFHPIFFWSQAPLDNNHYVICSVIWPYITLGFSLPGIFLLLFISYCTWLLVRLISPQNFAQNSFREVPVMELSLAEKLSVDNNNKTLCLPLCVCLHVTPCPHGNSRTSVSSGSEWITTVLGSTSDWPVVSQATMVCATGHTWRGGSFVGRSTDIYTHL